MSHLTALDFYVSYFMEGPVGHTFLSFIFDNAPPLSISIETRPEVGEGFAPVASLFKQFELIYVVGDERDLVRVRANYRHEPIYLYRLSISAEDARRLLGVYLARINQLADHAEFYQSADQQLHDQHRTVRERRRQDWQARLTSYSQRAGRRNFRAGADTSPVTARRRSARPAVVHVPDCGVLRTHPESKFLALKSHRCTRSD